MLGSVAGSTGIMWLSTVLYPRSTNATLFDICFTDSSDGFLECIMNIGKFCGFID